MKKFTLIICILLFAGAVNLSLGQSEKSDLADLLPGGNDGWVIEDEPEKYGADDLYFLINGGADLFLEYGFIEVISTRYINDNNFISVEIYEMEDPAAAYGIYTIKKYAEGESVDFGNAGSMLDSFLIFWKYNFTVIINASGSEPQIISEIEAIAKFIDDKIEDSEIEFEIAALLPQENISAAGIKYFEGMLGLNSVYVFGHKNIFGFTECAFAEFADHKLFVMGFGPGGDSSAGLKKSIESLKSNKKFSGFTEMYGGITFTDRRGKHLTIHSAGRYLVLTISENEFNPTLQIESIKEKL